jgi:hypothetical protein
MFGKRRYNRRQQTAPNKLKGLPLNVYHGKHNIGLGDNLRRDRRNKLVLETGLDQILAKGMVLFNGRLSQ